MGEAAPVADKQIILALKRGGQAMVTDSRGSECPLRVKSSRYAPPQLEAALPPKADIGQPYPIDVCTITERGQRNADPCMLRLGYCFGFRSRASRCASAISQASPLSVRQMHI